MDTDRHRGKGSCALFRLCERDFTFDLANPLGRHASDGFYGFSVRRGRRRRNARAIAKDFLDDVLHHDSRFLAVIRFI